MNSLAQFTGHWVGWIRQSSDSQHSIQAQTQAFNDFCDKHGITDRTVIAFVGSAMDNDPMTFFDRMRNEGVTAYDDYADLMRSGRVAGVWALDPTRYGRKKWLYSYMVEFAVDNGVVIYADGIGIINDSNFDAMVAISSIGSQADVKRLHGERAYQTRCDNCDAGIPPTGVVPFMYRILRDDTGARVGIEAREEYRPLMNLATDLILEGASYRSISDQITARGFDHFSRHHYVRRIFYNPILHGHMGYCVNDKNDGMWKIEAGHLIPSGVYMAYDVNPVWWSDDILPDVVSELSYRLLQNGGRGSRGDTKNPFMGLVKCARCGYNMNYQCIKSQGYENEYLRCQGRCGARNIRLGDVSDWFRERIEIALKHGILTLNQDNSPMVQWRGRLAQIEADIAEYKNQLRKLALEMITASSRVRGVYQGQMDKLDGILDGLELDRRNLLRNRPLDPKRQKLALEELQALTVDAFFKLTPGEMNGILRDLVGDARVFVEDYRFEVGFV